MKAKNNLLISGKKKKKKKPWAKYEDFCHVNSYETET